MIWKSLNTITLSRKRDLSCKIKNSRKKFLVTSILSQAEYETISKVQKSFLSYRKAQYRYVWHKARFARCEIKKRHRRRSRYDKKHAARYLSTTRDALMKMILAPMSIMHNRTTGCRGPFSQENFLTSSVSLQQPRCRANSPPRKMPAWFNSDLWKWHIPSFQLQNTEWQPDPRILENLTDTFISTSHVYDITTVHERDQHVKAKNP